MQGVGQRPTDSRRALCKRERSLILSFLNNQLSNAIYPNVKGVAFTCKACPSFKTVETVLKFTLCETLEGFMRSFAPHHTRDAVSGLCQRVIKTLWKPDIMWFYLPDMTVWFYSISISLETQYEIILSFLYVFRCFNQHIPRLSVNISRLRKIRAFLEVLNALSRITAECAGNLSIRHIIIIFADYIKH